jgi:DNA-binding HxlR family transcriptional regulator
MTNQEYGQFCGLARALEVVGEPWSLMVVRDLLAGPKTFTGLREGLPRMAAGMLSERLEELELADVITRREPHGRGGPNTVYELTKYGNELNPIVLALGRWGAKKLGGPRRDEIVTPASMVMALRITFRPEAARGLMITYLLRLGPVTIYARINDGHADIGSGSVDDPDLTIEAGPALKALMAGEMSPREALETDSVRVIGDPGLLEWFTELFHIPPVPPVRHTTPMSIDSDTTTPVGQPAGTVSMATTPV